MNITVLGHTLASPDNRVRWRRLAEQHPDCTVTIMPPRSYTTEGAQGRSSQFGAEPLSDGNFHQVPLPYVTTFGKWPRYRGLYGALLRSRPDIIYSISEVFASLTLQTLIVRRFLPWRPKVLFHSNENRPYSLAKLRHRWQESHAFTADGAVAENGAAAQLLRDHGFAKPILVQAAPGADEHLFAPRRNDALRRQLGLGGFVVGFVGGFRPEKGALDLVNAVGTMGSDVGLVLVGDGVQRPDIERRVSELGVGSRVKLAGFVPRSETAKYYQAMDAFVLPSRTIPSWAEQFGNVMAEAMLCGVPVIGSTCGAIPEVIGGHGLVYPEGDVQALADAIGRLRHDPALWADLSRRGREFAMARYSASAMAQAFHDFCLAALTPGKGTP